jgi:hypothetical protein
MQNKHYNNPFNPSKPLIFEGLEYKDMEGLLKPTIHVDEFAAKMGDDEDIIVISFFVRDLQAAKDLMAWFEKGYDFVLDADRSPGEIKPNRYLVYLEMRRRSTAPQNVNRLLEDLASLTEFEPNDWRLHYNDQAVDWSEQAFADLVPLTPDAYKKANESDLNEMRVAAGIAPKTVYEPKSDVRALQSMAGLR